jgi:septal ring factor EnvC (AmiA/AmiB activator)
MKRRKNMPTKTQVLMFMATGLLLPFFGCYRNDNGGGWFMNTTASPSAQTQQPTAVESAIALSDKYAKLSEEASTLRQQTQTLTSENQRLKDELQTVRSRLEQTQKELNDTNDLIVEMRVELNNWKNDVLGFRGEMRDAEKAQLEALLKLLKLMGGEQATTNPPTATQPLQGTLQEEKK